MYKLLLSLRFFRLRRINFLSVVCVALGVMVLVIVYSVLEGFQTQLKDSFRHTVPHILVERIPDQFYSPERYKSVIARVPGVTGVSERVEAVGLIGWRKKEGGRNTIANRAGQKGIYVLGIDPAEEQSVIRFREMLEGVGEETGLRVDDLGDPFRVSDEVRAGRSPKIEGILVGEELAKHLRLRKGDQVTVLSLRLDPDDPEKITPSNEPFYLVGAFESGRYEENLFTVYIPLEAGRELMARAGYSSRMIAIGTDDFDRAPEIKEAVRRALLDEELPCDIVTTWQERHRAILSALVVEKRVLTVLMFFLVLMASGTILAILYMMVLEKRRDIGILKALGAPMGGLLQLFLLNGGVIGLLGAVFGVSGGLVFLHYINDIENLLSRVFGTKVFSAEVYVFEELPVIYDAGAIATMGAATVFVSLLAALIPAYVAARSDPVRSLRNE